MIDEIYPRLFLEVIPDKLKESCEDFKSLTDGIHRDADVSQIFSKLVRDIYQKDPNSNIGLLYGKYLWPQTLCDYTRGIMTSEDIGSAIYLTERTHRAHGACYYPFMSQDNGVFALSLTFPFKAKVSALQRRFCSEAVFSFSANCIKSIADPDFSPIRVCFDFPEPLYSGEYKLVFGDNVEFDAPLNMMEIDDRYLSKRLATSNPILHQMFLKKSMIGQQEKYYSSTDFEQSAIACMIQHHPKSYSCEDIASRMNISVRGFQQRLQHSGVTFSEISNRTRRELAKVYLVQENRTIDWTTDKLGFQSRSGFSRFFRKEFRSTPSEFLATL